MAEKEEPTTIKVAATDMDGTLLTNNKTYDEVFFSRLFDKFVADDTKFVVASGNQYRQIIQQFLKYKHQMMFMVENGGHTIKNGRTLQEVFETEEAILVLVSYIEKYYSDTVINPAEKDSSYLPAVTSKKVKDLLGYYSPVLAYIDNLHPILDDHFSRVTLLVRDDLTFKARDDINMFLADYQLTATSSGFGCIDVIPSHVHKGTGLGSLLNHWGYTLENLMVFGDGGNDIETLTLVKYSLVMANAPREIKAVASYQAPSNQENGVLQVLSNHFLKGIEL